MPALHPGATGHHRQRGYTLIELSIAVLIALFLLGGLLTIVQNNRRSFGSQKDLAQLQDSERMAMTVLTNVIQQAGYFPDPTANTAASTLPATAPFAVGQSIAGTYAAAAPGDTIRVRYATGSGDGVLNCSGTSNTSGAIQTYVNLFAVVSGQLQCTMNGTAYQLVNNVQNLSVLYGVKTDFTVDNYNVDSYKTAAQMAAADWNNLLSVKITLSLNNPLYVASQTGQPQFIPFERIVGVMNRTGAKL